MSIATGAWDWRFAHECGKNPQGMEFIPWVYDNAQTILNGVLDCAEAAGRGDRDGLKTLYDCLVLEVQLCNQLGHARPEEGSEHYFAYAVENHMEHGLPHGDLVGPGIAIMSRLQGQATGRLEAALKACNIPLDKSLPRLLNAHWPNFPRTAKDTGCLSGWGILLENNMITTEQELISFLNDNGFRIQHIEHPAVFTCAEANLHHSGVTAVGTKNLFLCDKKGTPIIFGGDRL